MKTKLWTLSKLFDGEPKKENLALVEEDLPALQDGDILCEALYLSVNPYMRVSPVEFGQPPVCGPMQGEQLATMTAYFGLLRMCDPQPGEIVLVNSAAGSVGSTVGQLAKLKGCTVIGYTGSNEKCRWLKEELGFDHVFNYKKVDLDASLKQAAPQGVDCFFDNGKLKYRETVTEGFENMRDASYGMLKGDNMGKAIVKVK